MIVFHCLNPYCATATVTERAGTFCSRRCASDERLRRFRNGTNGKCVDCEADAMGGGVWCLDCFNAEDRNDRRKVAARRLSVWKGAAA